MSISPCCLQGFEWDGEPTGRTDKLGDLDTYVAGSNAGAAVLLIHDLFGWKFRNLRLLADTYAREADCTVYLPDFFGGESLPTDALSRGAWGELDLPGFIARNAREVREPSIFAAARALRERHGRLGVVGFCYGGWAAFRLGAAEHDPPLVDCATAGHPSLLTKGDIDGVAVPLQMLAPQFDAMYTAELKLHTIQAVQGVPLDYQHFPGVEHAAFVRGDPGKPGEREAMVRAKNAAVSWLRQFLHEVK